MTDFPRVRSRGGLAYGLELAQASAHDLPIWIVPWRFLPPGDICPARIVDASAHMGPTVLRWSDAKQDEFTSRARRGDKQRRINRISADATLGDLESLTASAIRVMPTTAAGAVLQQAVDVSKGCLADVEISDRSIDVELRTDTARLLVRITDGACDVEAIGWDPLIPDLETIESIVEHLATLASRLPSTDLGWHVEGVVLPQPRSFALLQLRPTPADRPFTTADPPEQWIARTRFVWGVFDVVVDCLEPSATDSAGSPFRTIVREHFVEQLEMGAVMSLEDGEPTLVLNRKSGFRLTHEPYNLPVASQRSRFFAAYLASGVPPRFRVVSDGDTAHFLEA